ncbi:hypothetical protein ACFPZI_30920 [Streptomyces chlorus]|uniref:Uncharacterized protein n=1 Tax=Streptomyces chlorus TaxID=887452 RepID=A0ABW1E5E3_9ACTN
MGHEGDEGFMVPDDVLVQELGQFARGCSCFGSGCGAVDIDASGLERGGDRSAGPAGGRAAR